MKLYRITDLLVQRILVIFCLTLPNNFKQLILLRSACTLKEKIESFRPKNEWLAELKLEPGFRVIGEYLSQIDSILRFKLKILWQFDSQYRVNLTHQKDQRDQKESMTYFAQSFIKYNANLYGGSSDLSTCESDF